MDKRKMIILSGVSAVVAVLLLIISRKVLLSLFIGALVFGVAYFVITMLNKPTSVKKLESEFEDSNRNLISSARKEIITLRTYANRITDVEMREPVSEIIKKSDAILDYINKNPEQGEQARNFIEYYIPATSKILYNYTLVVTNKLESEESVEYKNKVSTFLESIKTAFDKQLNALYDNKLLDANAELEVLKASLESEGLLKDEV